MQHPPAAHSTIVSTVWNQDGSIIAPLNSINTVALNIMGLLWLGPATVVVTGYWLVVHKDQFTFIDAEHIPTFFKVVCYYDSHPVLDEPFRSAWNRNPIWPLRPVQYCMRHWCSYLSTPSGVSPLFDALYYITPHTPVNSYLQKITRRAIIKP